MTVRRARRTTRSAGLVAVAAVAALSLTACQSGGGDGASGPEKQVSGSGSTGGSAPGGAGTGADGTRTGGGTGTTTAHRTTAPAAAGRAASPVGTQTLADGSKAEIHRLGDQHYLARIVHRGQVLATLETNQHDAGLDANDMFVVLTLGGQVHSWMGGGHQGPGTFHLAGGWTARVTRTGDLRYRAQILGHGGEVDATLEADQHDAGLDANGIRIVLSAGGVISAHA
ncbi:hypothetical protein [Streptomyces tropicalis]|uniref:Lipoprotein n=1 Tax=Streptomyces tropicalis TaxID=3034234 RepID=A0ABT6A7W9_9ACTN|nr:hypothetical protein [Streptomyces tropicalis]MDF3299915.1 hypothetical protein [Streptomyces tropicalis]